MDPLNRDGVVTLDASDRALIAAHLKRLDPDGRINRFCCVTTDELIDQYVLRIRLDQDIVLGTMANGRLVGVVHGAVFDNGRQRLCEIGISVDSDARKSGIGKRMLEACVDTARSLQIRRIYVEFMTSNRAMGALARSAGGRLVQEASESSAVFDAAAPPASLQRSGCIASDAGLDTVH